MIRYIDDVVEELSLANRIKNDDKEAFDDLYERYWSALMAFCYKLTQSESVSQEIVQDLFVELWINRSRLEIKKSLRSYLFNALKYKVLDHIKKSSKKEAYISEMLDVYTCGINFTEQEINLVNLERSYKKALEILPERCRQVFRLSREENQSIVEISQNLNISSQTVKNQISKALKILRVHLKEYVALLVFLVWI
ncbi:MAG: RNA polymerase sigma-70 factor [Cyclobacteriaceae bacterium]